MFLAVIFGACCFTSLAAFAVPAKPYGFYVEGSLGMSSNDLGLENVDFAYNFELGYKFNRYFGVEIGLIEDDYALYNVALKGTMPLANGFSLFGKVGVGMENEDTFTLDLEPVTYFAGGVGYNITPHLNLFIQESAITAAAENNIPGRYISLFGLNYIF